MEIIRGLQHGNNGSSVATIGFFDGVHLGHRFLIDILRKEANKRGLPSAVITFTEHPRSVLQQTYVPELLNSTDEKLQHLAETGVDYCYLLEFTPELSQLSANDFIVEILSSRLHVRALMIGYDHRFGHNRKDGFPEYVVYGKQCGMEIIEAPVYKDEHVSSSLIRKLLKEGNPRDAARLLTYPYSLVGRVVKGHRVGRTIGFPTANIVPLERRQLVPFPGVYAVQACIEGKCYKGMLSIGNRPTLNNGTDVSIGVHLFGFNEDIYGELIEIRFLDYLRENKSFGSLEELRKQLEDDKGKSLGILNSL